LHIAHFLDAAAHFEHRVVGRGAGVRRVEEQAVRKTRTPARGELPVLLPMEILS
jgi:hypothetical protein